MKHLLSFKLIGSLCVCGLAGGIGCKSASNNEAPDGVQVAATQDGKPAATAIATAATTPAQSAACVQSVGELLKSFKEPVRLTAYHSADVTSLDDARSRLNTLLKSYEQAASGKLQSEIKPVTDKDRESLLADGIHEQRTKTNAGQEAQRYYFGFKLESDGKMASGTLNPNHPGALEYELSSSVRELMVKTTQRRRIGVISGKGELRFDDRNLFPRNTSQGPSLETLLAASFDYYEIVDVQLDGAVDSQLDALVVTQPGEDYSVEELKRIDDFMMLGGKGLAVFASAANFAQSDEAGKASLSWHGLDKLLVGYGFAPQTELLLDVSTSRREPDPRIMYRPHASITLVDSAQPAENGATRADDKPPFGKLKLLAFPFASGIQLKPENQSSEVELAALVTSGKSTTSNADKTQSVNLLSDFATKGTAQERIIAASASGKLASAFDAADGRRTAPVPGRVLLVASGLFLTNPYAYLGNAPALGSGTAPVSQTDGAVKELQQEALRYSGGFMTGMILGLTNSLDWISGDSSFEECAALAQDLN